MSKDLGRLHDAARESLKAKRDHLFKTKESDSVLKKTRKTISQLDWGVEQYADELDNMMSRNASADEIRLYIRDVEEKALKDFRLLKDDSVHHKVQSRTGGDMLSNAKSADVRNVVKRLEQKYGIKYGNSSGPGGNLTADSSLSNYAHKSDDRARGLERASGIGKNPDPKTTAHARGTAGYAKNLKPGDIVNEQSLFTALDERVGAQINDYQTGVKTDQPRQQAIRTLTNDPLAYSPDATAADVAKTKQRILTTDPKQVKQSYLRLTGGKVSFKGVIPWFDYIGPLDQATGGHVESTIDKGVNVVREALGFKPNPVGHTEVKDPITNFSNGVARRIWDLGNLLTNQTNPYPQIIQ